MQTAALVETLKKTLKSNRITYAQIATHLKMSEANVKRLFASKRFTLDRLEEICLLMQMELSDLFEIYQESRQKISQLTVEQEKELIGDTKLLLVAVSVRNRLTYDDIINHYHVTTNECIQHLTKLDKLKIIDLLPHNRIKLRIDEGFRWLPNGPIERFFEKQIQNQFLHSAFSGEFEQRLFLSGLLSDSSAHAMIKKIQTLATEFTALHRQDAQLPLDKRHNIGLILAIRPWELAVFQPLQK